MWLQLNSKLLLLMVLLLVPSIVLSSDAYTFKQYDQVDLKISCFDDTGVLCASTIDCYITVISPNSTTIINNGTMTRSATYYNYTLNENQTSSIGQYSSVVYCTSNSYNQFSFLITQNGKDNPDSPVIVLFIILFLILLFYMVGVLLYGLGKIATTSFSLKDLALNFGGYFALFGLYMLEPQYLGNENINSFLLLFIQIGAVTSVFLPLVGFIITYFKQKMKLKMERGDYN